VDILDEAAKTAEEARDNANRIMFHSIPADDSHRLVTGHPLAIPVAVGQEEDETIIRYVCPDCRATWDRAFPQVTALEEFTDRFVPISTRRIARETARGWVAWPSAELDTGRPL
jgi:hypothetical protein